MDVRASLRAEVSAAALFAVVQDLSTYPDWLDIVPRAESVPAHDGDAGPAWSVDLRGQLGPLRRSKRLRMVRSRNDAPLAVRFERSEMDGRSHSEWVLEAEIHEPVGSATNAPPTETDSIDPDSIDPDASDPDLTGTELVMRLHYGGSLWVPMLDRLLADEIARSRTRLVALVGEAR